MYVLLLASGRGRRFSTERPKQFTNLAGRPVFLHSLAVLQQSPAVEGVGLLIPEGYRGLVVDLIDEFGLEEPDRILPGGETRRETVRIGLERLDEKRFPVVGVHDSARPNLTGELVRDMNIRFQRISGEAAGLVPGFVPADTVKTIEDDAPDREEFEVIQTLNRSELRLVQTPQLFSTPVLKEVHQGWPDDREVTDDASMLEAAGHRVMVVPGSRANRKLTYPEDRGLLEWLMKERNEEDE